MSRNHNADIYMQHEVDSLRTSNRWATLGIILVVLLAAAALLWAIDHYFGADGVRIFLIAAGIIAVVGIIYAMSIGVSAIYGGLAMRHHNNVLDGLVAFQRADDAGEIVRSVANNMGGVLRSGSSLEGKILTTANQLARQQTQALLSAHDQQQRQLTADADAGWYHAAAQFDDEIPTAWGQDSRT
jgi:hypothetical protein